MRFHHRKHTLEAIQYHTDSILSEGGDELFEVEKLRGGTREENPECNATDTISTATFKT